MCWALFVSRKELLPEHLHSSILQLASPAEMDAEKAKAAEGRSDGWVHVFSWCLADFLGYVHFDKAAAINRIFFFKSGQAILKPYSLGWKVPPFGWLQGSPKGAFICPKIFGKAPLWGDLWMNTGHVRVSPVLGTPPFLPM